MGFYIAAGILFLLWLLGLLFGVTLGVAHALLLIGAIVLASLKLTEHVRT